MPPIEIFKFISSISAEGYLSMASEAAILRKYGEATTIPFDLVEFDGVDL